MAGTFVLLLRKIDFTYELWMMKYLPVFSDTNHQNYNEKKSIFYSKLRLKSSVKRSVFEFILEWKNF